MEPEVASRIFEPFFTTKPQGKGTGLGLATVYGFADRLGGTVTVESEPGAGATFTLRLPIAEVESSSLPIVAPEAPLPNHSGRRLLLVDDEPGVRRGTRRLLEKRGYIVLEAGSADEALAVLEHATVDIVLTDHAMPGRTGRQLINDLLERQPELRVVLMSGFAGEGDVRADIAGRTVRFLAKPFTLAELLRALD